MVTANFSKLQNPWFDSFSLPLFYVMSNESENAQQNHNIIIIIIIIKCWVFIADFYHSKKFSDSYPLYHYVRYFTTALQFSFSHNGIITGTLSI